MTVTSISSLSGGASQDIQRANAKLQAAIASIVSGTRYTNAGDNVAAVSLAAQLKSFTSGLRQVSGNLAQTSSALEVADGGAKAIQNVLAQLQTLAQQAQSPVLNDQNRQQLNQQFQQLATQIDQIASTTNFNSKPLLDGSVSGDNALSLSNALSGDVSDPDLSNALTIPPLTTSKLFGGQNPGLLSAEATQQAITVLGKALAQVLGVRSDIGSFAESLNYAQANIDSAVINQQAALSNLSDTDLGAASTLLSLGNVQSQASTAVAAQGNNLTSALLDLLG